MKHKGNRRFSRLYWQVSLVFLMALFVFGSITLYISIKSARSYSVEVNQKLNWNLAKNTVQVIKPQFQKGEVKKETFSDLLHSMMVINPSIEIYLLDPEGKILGYVAPEKVVKMDKVSLTPIKQFLTEKDQTLTLGDDPRNPGEKKLFLLLK